VLDRWKQEVCEEVAAEIRRRRLSEEPLQSAYGRTIAAGDSGKD